MATCGKYRLTQKAVQSMYFCVNDRLNLRLLLNALLICGAAVGV
jgi:hypothetical protein